MRQKEHCECFDFVFIIIIIITSSYQNVNANDFSLHSNETKSSFCSKIRCEKHETDERIKTVSIFILFLEN